MEYSINTEKLKTVQTTLTQERQKLIYKSSVFYAGAFGSSGNLSSALLKIQNTYKNIPQTLENIRMYLKEYVDDVEAFENAMSGNGGYVKFGAVASAIRTSQSLSRNKLFSYEMDSAKLFQVKTYQPKKTTQNTGSPTDSAVNTGQTQGNADETMMDQDLYPDFDFNLPDFDFSAFDFNLDALENLDVLELSLGNIMGSMNFDLSSLSSFSTASLGAIGSLTLGSINMNLGNLGSIGLGTLDISKLGNLNLSDLDISSNLILKDILSINGIDISGITNLGQLSTIDLKGIDLSNLTLSADTLKMLQNQISLGNITEMEALGALQQLFPGMANMSLSEIMKRYNVSGLGGMDSVSSLGMNGFDTGAFKGVGVSSALVLGFGAIGGIGGAFAARSGSKSKMDASSKTSSSSSSSSHKNSFAGLGDAIMNGGTFGATVTADVAIASHQVDLSDEQTIHSSSTKEMINPLFVHLALDYDTILQDAFSKLKKFNQTKKSSRYLDLIEDSVSVSFVKSISKMEERISFLIPSILPDLIKKYYLYYEVNQQNIVPKNINFYRQLYAVIHNYNQGRFKWLNLETVANQKKIICKSALNIIDQTVNCGNVLVTKQFKNAISWIIDGVSNIVDTYEQIYNIEVPKVFHSDITIDDRSSNYDVLYEKLESLSVQATLNNLSTSGSKKYLSTALRSLNISDSQLYCFQDMYRIKEQGVDTIVMVRIGDNTHPYRYYACYPGVGLKEINSVDVKMLMQAGFQLKEE